mmetsp:Transcript_17672/g.23284  ORF Transcript_17672/g.23284 Transcript_17672/m.23284 type:complete len:100 (+) Transcript_17672:1561-1860(+)
MAVKVFPEPEPPLSQKHSPREILIIKESFEKGQASDILVICALKIRFGSIVPKKDSSGCLSVLFSTRSSGVLALILIFPSRPIPTHFYQKRRKGTRQDY